MSKYRLFVLILVVMDYSLVRLLGLEKMHKADCLNPCCNGL